MVIIVVFVPLIIVSHGWVALDCTVLPATAACLPACLENFPQSKEQRHEPRQTIETMTVTVTFMTPHAVNQ